jgi:NTP pyrophosphatase (non-canonical NTP hydrolase)
MLNLIREKVPQEELLAQLAEEAVELAHAALKLRRTYGDINPTPVKRTAAFARLKEEIADVKLLLTVLELDRHGIEYDRIGDAKLKRWAERLGAAEEG